MLKVFIEKFTKFGGSQNQIAKVGKALNKIDFFFTSKKLEMINLKNAYIFSEMNLKYFGIQFKISQRGKQRRKIFLA